MVRSKINPRYWSTRRNAVSRLNTLRFQPAPGNRVSTDPAMQIAGNDNMAEKLTSLQAAAGESLTPKLKPPPRVPIQPKPRRSRQR